MIDLSNKVILVTGSSRGLGRGLAIGLARQKARVPVHYLNNKTAAEQTGKDITEFGHKPLIISADVRRWEGARYLIDSVIRFYGRIDVLINNVGAFFQSSLQSLSIDAWHSLLDSNLNSVFYCSKAALPHMRQQQKGRIINIGLANADRFQAYKRIAAYAVAKSGILILTKSMAIEEAENGITINAVSPGLMNNGNLSETKALRQQKAVPQKRLGTADDLLYVIVNLINDRAEYITGSNTVVSGGWGL